MATLQSNAVQISIVTDGAYVEQDTEIWSVKESTTFSASSSTKVVERVAVAVAAAAALHRAKPRVARKGAHQPKIGFDCSSDRRVVFSCVQGWLGVCLEPGQEAASTIPTESSVVDREF